MQYKHKTPMILASLCAMGTPCTRKTEIFKFFPLYHIVGLGTRVAEDDWAYHNICKP